LDKALSSIQAHDNQWGKGRRTIKEEKKGEKKEDEDEDEDEIGANHSKF